MPRNQAYRRTVLKGGMDLQKIIEKAAEPSSSKVVKSIRKLPILRDLVLRESFGKGIVLNTVTKLQAALAYCRGYNETTPCTTCQGTRVPFDLCISHDGYLKGGCANCFFLRDSKDLPLKCSHATQDRKFQANQRLTTLSKSYPAHNQASTLQRQTWKKSPESFQPSDMFKDVHTCQDANSEINTVLPENQDYVVVAGHLKLAHPSRSEFSFAPEYVQMILDLLPHIQKLDSRDLTTLPGRITDLDNAFQRFKKAEMLEWKKASRLPDPGSTLVRPSGSLDAEVAHRLHQPSMTTLQSSEDSETADISNGCTAMIMGNGYQPNKTLLYDHLHRRSERSEGLQEYPENVLKIHEDFTHEIQTSSAAKVEIIYGKPVRERILRSPDINLTILPLWAEYKGMYLGLLHENNFKNQDRDYRFRRILLFATHPQSMFYERPGSVIAIQQDQILKVALLIAMVEQDVEYDSLYYREKRWINKVPSIYEAGILIAKGVQAAREIRFSQQDVMMQDVFRGQAAKEEFDQVSERKHQHGFFNKKPHSQAISRCLLPSVIKALQESDIDSIPRLSDLPFTIQEWLCGLKQVFFNHGSVKDIEDFRFAIEQIMKKSFRSTERPGLANMLQLLIKAQQASFSSKVNKLDDLWFIRLDGKGIPTSCPCGSLQNVDTLPRFLCTTPEVYVIRMSGKGCKSVKCNKEAKKEGVRKSMRPISGDIVWTSETSVREKSEAASRHTNERFAGLLQDQTAESTSPPIVELWCVKCGDKTRIPNGSNVFVDSDPRWTIGRNRPLYVERISNCRHCLEMGEISGRFVPRDPTIPSINASRLRQFAQVFEGVDDEVKAYLLDSWPPSARSPRRPVIVESGRSCTGMSR